MTPTATPVEKIREALMAGVSRVNVGQRLLSRYATGAAEPAPMAKPLAAAETEALY